MRKVYTATTPFAEVLADYRSNSNELMGRFLHHHHYLWLSYARPLCSDMETAEDIVGEFELAMLSMTEAQRKIAFEQPEKYWGYFYRMVRNKAVDCHRKFFRDKAPRKELSTYSDGIIDAAADDVLQELHAKNLKELLNADADGNLWTFMRLRYEGMNREAIMNTMNISKHSYTKLSKKLENFLRKNQR